MSKTHKNVSRATATKRLFRGDYGVLYQIGSRGTMRVEDFIRAGAYRLHKASRLIAFDLIVLRNPKHRSNGGKCMNVARRPGYIKLATVRKAA